MNEATITLSVANVRGRPDNKLYPHNVVIKSEHELAETLQFDHVAGLFKNNERGNNNFIKANCLIMDCDNDSDDARKWQTPESISARLPGVAFYSCYSRNHMKQKGEKSPRPKFHVYFILKHDITSESEVRRYKEKILSVIPEFDANAKDAARFIFGVETPQIKFFNGDLDIIEYLNSLPEKAPNLFDDTHTESYSQSVKQIDTLNTAPTATISHTAQKKSYDYSGVIKEGERNATLYRRGIHHIIHSETLEKAKSAWDLDCERCESPLPFSELNKIWQSVLESDAFKIRRLAEALNNRAEFLAKTQNYNRQDIVKDICRAIYDSNEYKKLFSFAVQRLMQYKTTGNAYNRFIKDISNYVARLGMDYINEVWEDALNVEAVRLAILARKYKGNKEVYEEEALKISDDEKLISNIWDKEDSNTQQSSKSASYSIYSGEKKKSIPLNINAVNSALKKLGITIKLNKITQRVIVENLPHENPYVLEDIHNLSGLEFNNVALSALPGILLPYLRDLNYSCSLELIELYLNTIAQSRAFNPVEDMLKSKKWDGNNRLSELYKIMGIESNEFYCTLTRKWLIQAVAMALNDNGKHSCEFVLTLQGAQGAGKTEFFRNIAVNPEWFKGATVIDLRVKDTYIEALTHWICELGEVDDTFKKEQAQLKGFITDNKAIYRMPYARSTTERPRRTVFGATVNPERFIKDSTGGTRRWATIRITRIDSEKMRNLPLEWYQQLWAQAYDLFVQNEKEYRLTEDERAKLERENQSASDFIRGEAELIENLDWSQPVEKWTFKTPTQFINEACLQHSLRPAEVGRALQKMMTYESRIQAKRSNHGTLYLLPMTNYLAEQEQGKSEYNVFIQRTEYIPESHTDDYSYIISEQESSYSKQNTPQVTQWDFDTKTQTVIKEVNAEYKNHKGCENGIVSDTVKLYISKGLQEENFERDMKLLTENDAIALDKIFSQLNRYQEAELAQRIWVAKYNERGKRESRIGA